MTDIVERIRFLASGQNDPHSVELTAAADEIERLREALRVIADGDAPRDHAIIYRSDGVHSKHDRCRHGAWMYDGCEDCVTEYARAALGEGEE